MEIYFVSDESGGVSQIDLSSGAAELSFNTYLNGLDALGSLNGNLLAAGFLSTAIDVYSTSGVLQTSINLASLPSSFSWNGLASDGSSFYLADYYSGRIYKYSLSGALLGYFSAGGSYQISGLSYDASNHSLWVAELPSGGAYSLVDFSTSGTELSEFSTGSFEAAGGIAVVPIATPEPS